MGTSMTVTKETNMKTVREIVYEWLMENGYDGLFDGDSCCCILEDLMPTSVCDECGECEAGYISEGDNRKEFYIGATK